MKLCIPYRVSRPLSAAGLALGLFLTGHTFSFAQTSTWNTAGSGNWDVGGNWIGGVPTGAGFAEFTNGGTAQLPGSVSGTYTTLRIGSVARGSGSLEVSGGQLLGGEAYLGDAPHGIGSATVSSGTWSNSSDLFVGNSGTGNLLVNGGLVKGSNGYIGYESRSVGRATVSSGTWSNSDALFVGFSGAGNLLVNGGLVTNTAGYIGWESGGSATVSSGTWSNHILLVGFSGAGNLLVNGGLVTSSYGTIGLIGRGGMGSATVSSGTWSNVHSLSVGVFGPGTLTVSGGLVSADSMPMGSGSGGRGAGSLILSGSGVVQTRQISKGSGTGTILFNGGTLRAGATEADILSGFEPGDVTIGAGGAFIDSNTWTIGIGTAMSGAGALTKLGLGTLTLIGNNDYSGGTAINGGTVQTLNRSALGSGALTINSGATLQPRSSLTVASLAWNAGNVLLALGPVPLLDVSGAFTKGGQGGAFQFEGTGMQQTTYTLVTFGTTDFTENQFSAGAGNSNVQLQGQFLLNPNDLQFTVAGATATGAVLQNSNPVNIPAIADFTVDGVVQTGGPANDNTVNSLVFNPGSSLRIFNNLTVTSGDFTVGSGRATMRGGNVIVPGALNKLGGGLLNIFSNALVNGPANVRAGSLLVNGIFTASGGLTVFQNALLGGSGLVNGDVFNRGTISPGNSPGTLTVDGDFTQFSSGILLIEIASPSVFDRLVVRGHASLAGTLQALNFGGNKLKYGQHFAFLQAESISGEFDQILLPDPNKFRSRFLVEGGTGTLLVAPISYTLVAETTNQHNVAKALDSFISARGDDREMVSTALDFLSEDQYPAAFDQIAPTFYESLTDITIEQINTQNQMLVQRLGSLRLGARGFQAIGMESLLMNDKDGKSVLDAKDGKDILAPSADNHWGAFAMGNGIFAKASPANQLSDYHFEGGGFAAGLDYHWSENFATGVYVGYQGAYAKYDNGSTAAINGVNFGGYATYKNGGLYADAILGGGYNGYDVRRSIEFSNVNRTARSNPGGANLTTYLNTGYDWQAGPFTFGPILGGQYTYAGIGSFTERNADSLNLKVGQQNGNSLRLTLGGHVAYTWKVTDYISIIPEVRMLWQHEFLENPRNIGASLDSGSGPSFDYETSTPDRDAVFAGAGVSAQFGENWNAFFFYNADFGRQDYLGHAISGGVGWKF